VELLENAEISVDELSEKIKLATELIKICEEKLTSTEAEVSKIIHALSE
jgi:exodeoxyribonuclease VII small subunit